jgi:hypothetical protein
MGAAVKVERLGGGELRVIVGWATPPAGYSPMATSKKGGWAKVLCPGVSVRWYPGTDPVYQARKERAAERRAAKKLATKAAAHAAAEAETTRLVTKARAVRAASKAAHDALISRLRAERDARVEAELATLSVVVTSPPPVWDMTHDAVLIPEPPVEAFMVLIPEPPIEAFMVLEAA